MESATEAYVRNSMRPALRRQFQIIALRIIAEGGGRAEIDRIRQAIQARHPEIRWDRRYPVKVLADNGIIIDNGTTVELVEQLDPQQIASLLSALDERAVRTEGLRLEDASWRADQLARVVAGSGRLVSVGDKRPDQPAAAMSRSSRRQDGARGAAPCGRPREVGSRELASVCASNLGQTRGIPPSPTGRRITLGDWCGIPQRVISWIREGRVVEIVHVLQGCDSPTCGCETPCSWHWFGTFGSRQMDEIDAN